MNGTVGKENQAMQHVLVEPSCSISRNSSSWDGCSGCMPTLGHQRCQHGTMSEEHHSLAPHSWTPLLVVESGAAFRTRPVVQPFSCVQTACSSSSLHASSPCRAAAARLPGLGSYCSKAAWNWRTTVEPLMSFASCSPAEVARPLETQLCEPIYAVFACGAWAAAGAGSVRNDWPSRPLMKRQHLQVMAFRTLALLMRAHARSPAQIDHASAAAKSVVVPTSRWPRRACTGGNPRAFTGSATTASGACLHTNIRRVRAARCR